MQSPHAQQRVRERRTTRTRTARPACRLAPRHCVPSCLCCAVCCAVRCVGPACVCRQFVTSTAGVSSAVRARLATARCGREWGRPLFPGVTTHDTAGGCASPSCTFLRAVRCAVCIAAPWHAPSVRESRMHCCGPSWAHDDNTTGARVPRIISSVRTMCFLPSATVQSFRTSLRSGFSRHKSLPYLASALHSSSSSLVPPLPRSLSSPSLCPRLRCPAAAPPRAQDSASRARRAASSSSESEGQDPTRCAKPQVRWSHGSSCESNVQCGWRDQTQTRSRRNNMHSEQRFEPHQRTPPTPTSPSGRKHTRDRNARKTNHLSRTRNGGTRTRNVGGTRPSPARATKGAERRTMQLEQNSRTMQQQSPALPRARPHRPPPPLCPPVSTICPRLSATLRSRSLISASAWAAMARCCISMRCSTRWESTRACLRSSVSQWAHWGSSRTCISTSTRRSWREF